MATDYSTPEGALQALEAAYFHEDLEAAVAAKDFSYQARAMFHATNHRNDPDGGKSRDTLHAAKTNRGWRIVVLPPGQSSRK
jgi:hypothetical protein